MKQYDVWKSGLEGEKFSAEQIDVLKKMGITFGSEYRAMYVVFQNTSKGRNMEHVTRGFEELLQKIKESQ